MPQLLMIETALAEAEAHLQFALEHLEHVRELLAVFTPSPEAQEA